MPGCEPWLASRSRPCLWAWSAWFLGASYGIGTALLLNNYIGPAGHRGDHWHFWFIEVFVQLVLIVTALLAVPAIRRLERRFPYGFPLALFAGTLDAADGVGMARRLVQHPVPHPHHRLVLRAGLADPAIRLDAQAGDHECALRGGDRRLLRLPAARVVHRGVPGRAGLVPGDPAAATDRSTGCHCWPRRACGS